MAAEWLCPAGWAGVDEVGRGPLVGSVVAAAVMLPLEYDLPGLTDSKKLTARKRELLSAAIREQALAWAVAEASAAEVDALNVLQATFLAMRRAVAALSLPPEGIWVDGNRCPSALSLPCRAVVGGDGKVAAISAASILAKVARDAQMHALHLRHPDYGFDRHKGYPTPAHLAALQRLGPLAEHRRSFAPVQQLLAQAPLFQES